MNVSGIRPNAGFYEYNSIKINELRDQQIAETQALLAKSKMEPAESTSLQTSSMQDQQTEQEDARSRQTYDAYDYAQQYQAGEIYNLKGADSNIEDLDVEKALSNLEKDQVLQQYQFFVGTDATMSAQSDMLFRPGENFNL